MATPQQKNPCPRGHKIYTFGRPILGHHYLRLFSLSGLYPKLPPPPLGIGSHDIYNFLSPYPTDATYQI